MKIAELFWEWLTTVEKSFVHHLTKIRPNELSWLTNTFVFFVTILKT